MKVKSIIATFVLIFVVSLAGAANADLIISGTIVKLDDSLIQLSNYGFISYTDGSTDDQGNTNMSWVNIGIAPEQSDPHISAGNNGIVGKRAFGSLKWTNSGVNPFSAFTLSFDYGFNNAPDGGSNDCRVKVEKDGVTLYSWNFGSPGSGNFTQAFNLNPDGYVLIEAYAENFSIASINNIHTSAVPLPGALSLLGTGLMGLGALGWRRRQG